MKWAVLLFLFSPCIALANTKGEEDTMVINPLGGSDFEVVQDRSSAAFVFWCGAATYVERRQGLPGTTTIYLKRGRGPAQTVDGTFGVVFTTDGAGLPPADADRLTLRVDRPGDRMLAVNARRYCRDAFTRSTK